MSVDAISKYKFVPDNATDNAQAFMAMYFDLAALEAARKPMPCVKFAEGRYNYSGAPNFALNNLDIRGEGQVEFVNTGNDVGFVLDGNSKGPIGGGKFNLNVEDIRFVPSAVGTDTLVIKSIHHSRFRVKAYGAGNPRNGVPNKAVAVYWNVCTQFDNLTISPFDVATSAGPVNNYNNCIGLWLDRVTVPSDLQTSDCIFWNAIIESCRVGAYLQDAGGCKLYGGTIEGCSDTGMHIETGGQNKAWGLWFEGNSNYDVSFGAGAHNNVLDTTHPSALKIKNNASWFSGNSVS